MICLEMEARRAGYMTFCRASDVDCVPEPSEWLTGDRYAWRRGTMRSASRDTRGGIDRWDENERSNSKCGVVGSGRRSLPAQPQEFGGGHFGGHADRRPWLRSRDAPACLYAPQRAIAIALKECRADRSVITRQLGISTLNNYGYTLVGWTCTALCCYRAGC